MAGGQMSGIATLQKLVDKSAVYSLLPHKSLKSFTVDLKGAWLENQARLSFFTTFGLCNPI
jgi:hypothetical protein